MSLRKKEGLSVGICPTLQTCSSDDFFESMQRDFIESRLNMTLINVSSFFKTLMTGALIWERMNFFENNYNNR